jgi:hypothetical protein
MRGAREISLPYSPAHAQAPVRYTELSPERFKNFSAGARFGSVSYFHPSVPELKSMKKELVVK